MTISQAQTTLQQALHSIYPPGEANTITQWVMESITGFTRLDRLSRKEEELSHSELLKWNVCMDELLQHKPVQYVLGEAWFFRLKFYVNEAVLIPRPETEELVSWILDDAAGKPLSLLDIGTGSGCIAVSLKKNNPGMDVHACDISTLALQVATRNAREAAVVIHFFEADILSEQDSRKLGVYDVIVSNPPYIPITDKKSMDPNVLNHEPHLALFTEGDAFLFYGAIINVANDHLHPGGKLFFEIHEQGGEPVTSLLQNAGWKEIILRNDLYGKPRMISARKPGHRQ